MADAGSNVLVSESELAAAKAEADRDTALPTLDEPTAEVVVVPVPQPQPDLPQAGARAETSKGEADEPQPGGGQKAGANASAAPVATPTERASSAALATETQPAEEAAGAAGGPANDARQRRGPVWLVDRGLDFINRPFGWLGPSARQIVGVIALLVLLLSAAAPLLAPLFPKRRDAISFLEEKRAALPRNEQTGAPVSETGEH